MLGGERIRFALILALQNKQSLTSDAIPLF